jgi:DNA polymerase-3 subunit epsilon
MGKLDKDIFVCIDCETTGLDAEKDAIVEVAGMRFCGDEVIERFESLIDPECAISETSMAIHRITPEMVAGKPKIREVLEPMLKLIGRYPIIGHGVGFDIATLVNASKKHGITCQITNNLTIDTLRMARLYGGSAVNSLEQLRRHFNIPSGEAHRAMSDVIVNVALFNQLAKNHQSTESLLKVLSKPILMRIMPLGKYKGRAIKDLPLEYLLWAARLDFDQDLLFSLRHEINRRKQGNLFSQAGNPFSDL